jgi:uncharacterized phage-associated protein
MRLRFDEAKATQAAALFLALRGSPMSYMKLLKLLYMADRTALLRWGRPITMDRFVSMKHGPVLSTVYSLLVDEPAQGSIWSEFISAPENYEVKLLKQDAPNDRLSAAEESLIRETFQSYGGYERWALVDYLHKVLPEWKNPGDTSVPITLRDILGIEYQNEAEVAEIEDELYSFSNADALLQAG